MHSYKNSGTVQWTVCFYHLYTKGAIDIYDTETDTSLQNVYLMTELSLMICNFEYLNSQIYCLYEKGLLYLYSFYRNSNLRRCPKVLLSALLSSQILKEF